MKERRIRTASASATADLFAVDSSQLSTADEPTQNRASSSQPARPQLERRQPALTALKVAAPVALERAQPLWYAAVFPEFRELQAAVLQRLGRFAQRFTPRVSIEMPDALLLELRGSVKLFGSLDLLLAEIDTTWGKLNVRAQGAAAPTALAALWLARAGKLARVENPAVLASVLAELPIGCTSWAPEWLQTLRTMGVMRIGDVLRLPRAGVARRLGTAALLDLDVAMARQASPRRAFVPRERFRERCDFETEIETVDYLQKAIEPMIEQCAQFLRKRQAGVQALELRLRHRAIPVTRVQVGLASITSERRRLSAVLEENLRRLELSAPVRGMELVSGRLQPLSANSLDAFAGSRGADLDTAPQLVERLRARLGESAVYGLCSMSDHRPEAAWQRVQQLLSTSIRPKLRTEQDMPRPVWLLAEPKMLAVACRKPAHPQALLLEQGPERIESGWWDGKDVARDYYIARHVRGARWWVFQERQTRLWYLHGVFA